LSNSQREITAGNEDNPLTRGACVATGIDPDVEDAGAGFAMDCGASMEKPIWRAARRLS
jgi:hypothetical protein